MTAAYACPSCDGRLRSGDTANSWRCRRCGARVLEAIDDSHQHVREFYRRATGGWGGVRA